MPAGIGARAPGQPLYPGQQGVIASRAASPAPAHRPASGKYSGSGASSAPLSRSLTQQRFGLGQVVVKVIPETIWRTATRSESMVPLDAAQALGAASRCRHPWKGRRMTP